MLIEFYSKNTVAEIKQYAQHKDSDEHIPVYTTMLWFRDRLSLAGNKSMLCSKKIVKFGLTFPTHNIIKSNLYPIKSVMY